MANIDILEPIRAYKLLKDQHHESVVNSFEELTKQSGVNPEENKITCTKLHKEESNLSKVQKSLGKLTLLLVLCIILIIAGVITGAVGIFKAVEGENSWLSILIGVLCLVLGIVLLIAVYRPKSKELSNKANEIQKKIDSLLSEAKAQMAPLNALFDASLSAKLFSKTIPLIEMDRIFDVKKYALMRDRYDMWDNLEENSSTLDLQSGSILGNPFVIFKDMNMNMVPHQYTGTLSVSYTVGSGQNRHTETEVLRASVTEPAPQYSKETYLVYGNEACTKLSFSRTPSNINSLKLEDIPKYVSKHEKDLDKLAAKELKKGGCYTPIGNPEFELFFGGLNRDHEVEFRMLFTALGQRNMMDLLKSKDGFGDDFNFRKIKGLNVIQSAHSQGNVLFTDEKAFMGFEYETMKDFFISYNDAYFKALFFDFAPLLSIPLYQQTKTHEYIYKDVIKSNFTPFEHEVVANKFDVSTFAHRLTKTNVILKTLLSKKDGEGDVVNVTAHSFDTADRITYVSVMARNGRTYQVPVHWTEYLPLQNVTTIRIDDVGEDNQVKFKSLGQNNVIYAKGLLSNSGDHLNVDIKQIKDFMKKV